jgi:hypothetical protein
VCPNWTDDYPERADLDRFGGRPVTLRSTISPEVDVVTIRSGERALGGIALNIRS